MTINYTDAAEWRRRADAVNEGGEGYAHVVGWSGHTGKEILAKHGLTPEQIDDVTAAVDAHFPLAQCTRCVYT